MKSKMRLSMLTFVLITFTASLLFLGCPMVDTFNGTVTITGGTATLDTNEQSTTPYTATPAGFAEGATLTYTWSVLDDADTDITDAGSTTDEATFTPAPIATAGTYTVKVVVSDGTNEAEDTETLVVTDITAETQITLSNLGTFGVYTETNEHKTQEWLNPVFIINRTTDSGNVQEAISNVESTTSPEEGSSFIEASISPDGIIYFGNGRPESPIITNLGTWSIHFKAKADTDGVSLNVLADDASWSTPLAEDITLTDSWDDYTITGNSLTDLALIIFTNKDTVDRTIAIDDLYIAHDARIVLFAETVSGSPMDNAIEGTSEAISCSQANWGSAYGVTMQAGTYEVDSDTAFSVTVSWDAVSGETPTLILSPSEGAAAADPSFADGLLVNLTEWGAQVVKTTTATGPDWANANSQFAWTSGGTSGYTDKELTFTFSYDGTNWKVDATDGTTPGSISLADMTDATIFSTGAYLHVGVPGGTSITNPLIIKQINGTDLH